MPVVDRSETEFWWHSAPLPDGTRTKSVQEWSQDTQFLMWSAIEPLIRDVVVGKQVLDIGAADGFFSIAAAAAGAHTVHAIDQNYPDWPRNIRFLSESWSLPVEIFTGDFRTFRFGQTYDLIMFMGVLYHVEDVFSAIRRLHGLLAPGGRVVIESQMSQITGIGYPVFEGASDLYPTIARQGLHGVEEVGGSNYLLPNAEAVRLLAHMYRFSCTGPLACEYTDHNPFRQLFVLQRLPDGAERWVPSLTKG